MKLRIRQAVYGEKNNAHQLLIHSGEPDVIFEEIKRFTDLPMQLPPGTVWDSYYTGLPYKGAYVLAKTFSDPDASRKGMVRTHVLIAQLEQLVLLTDLGKLFDLLPSSLHDQKNVETLEIEIDENARPVIPEPARFLDAAKEILADGSTPVLWAEPSSFQQLVVTIWANSPYKIRGTFAFGTSFMPEDLRDRAFNVVSAIVTRETKWTSRKLIKSVSEKTEIPPAEALLLGLPNKKSIEKLITDLDGEGIESFKQLRLISSLARYAKALDEGADVSFVEVLSHVRLIEALSPNVDNAVELKTSAVAALESAISTASAEQLKSMRNMQLNGFGNSREKVRKALVSWIKKNASKSASASLPVSALIKSSIEDSTGILLEGVKEYFSDPSHGSDLTSLIWNMWLVDEGNVHALAPLIAKNSGFETLLLESVPRTLSKSLATTLENWTLERKWHFLHFLIASSHRPLTEAIDNQGARTNQKFKRGWIEPLVRRERPSVILNAIVECHETELSSLASELALSNPPLLAGLDFALPMAQEIATEVIANKSSEIDTKDLCRIVHSVLDLMIEDKPVADSLLLEMSRSRAANLVDYPRRDRLWMHRLPSTAYDEFVSATSVGWLQNFANSDSDEMPIEPALEVVVTGNGFLREFLSTSGSKAPSILVRFYRRFENLSGDRFDNDLIAVQGSIRKFNYIDSVSIGKLISDRSWSRSAGRIADDVLGYDRKDLIPAINQCSHLLGLYHRAWGWFSGRLDSVNISESEWWDILEEVLADLYPMGPQDNEVWSRAKGKKSVLDYNGNGLQRWHSTLRDLRNGSGGKNITVQGLLSEALKDYSKNKKLNLLKELGKKLRLD